MKTLILGAGGFIGHNLSKRLKAEGHEVIGVDLKHNEFETHVCDKFIIGDLRQTEFVKDLFQERFDRVYQLAADMGGAGYIFTGAHDADIMHNSAQINLNVAEALKGNTETILFYASSACIYPEDNQLDPQNPNCEENSAFPASPDSEYGWEKLFSERFFLAYHRNYGLNIRIARFHNIYGPFGAFDGGREKAPAALCRKVAQADNNSSIEIWGDGEQTRSFLFIDECLNAIERLLWSDHHQPINIGSTEMLSINQLVKIIIEYSGKNIQLDHIDGPQGVRGRCSDNRLIQQVLGWEPQYPISIGITQLYDWISSNLELRINK